MHVAAYARVSSRRQAQAQTIEQQLDRLRAHAAARGWALAQEHVFRDDGYSGTMLARPGLDRRSRSMITLTALVARGHHDELAMHVRAARRNGLTEDEIKELLMQTAISCGVPDANTAFRIASAVLAEP